MTTERLERTGGSQINWVNKFAPKVLDFVPPQPEPGSESVHGGHETRTLSHGALLALLLLVFIVGAPLVVLIDATCYQRQIFDEHPSGRIAVRTVWPTKV